MYEALESKAKVQLIEGQDCLVYEGFTTKVFTALRLSPPYYTAVINELKRMDCIRQLRRGGSSTPSKWLLVRKPTLKLHKEAPGLAKTTDTKMNQVLQMLNDMNKRLTALEARMNSDA